MKLRTKAAIGVACVGVTAYVALPRIVEHSIRNRLGERGFPNARLDVESVGLDHLELRNVHLDDGLDLGTVEIDQGMSLLWGNADELSIKHANVTAVAMARAAGKIRRTGSGSVPFKRARVADSTLDVRGKQTRVAATADRKGNALDVTISIRDPGKSGWSANASGRVVVNKSLSTWTATGTAQVDRVALGGVDLTDVTVPFSYAEGSLRISASAKTFGGELSVEPTVVGRSTTAVVHAHGLQLAALLAPTRRVTGSGLVDGRVALHVDATGWSLDHGELHARGPGRISVADPSALQKQSDFALHTRIVNALKDFQFDKLAVELAPPGAETELRLMTRGRGRHNKQELDVAIGVRGARDLATKLPGASR